MMEAEHWDFGSWGCNVFSANGRVGPYFCIPAVTCASSAAVTLALALALTLALALAVALALALALVVILDVGI